MPAFSDIRTFTVRAGPAIERYGDPWRAGVNGEVQHDRKVYLSAIAAPEGDYTDEHGGKHHVIAQMSVSDQKQIIRETRRLARIYGWTEILWTREREDGTTHLVRITIRAAADNAA